MTVQLIGINGNPRYNAWKRNVLLALKELKEMIILEEINHVDQIIESGIRSIPALRMDGNVLINHINQTPDKEEFIELIKRRLSKLNNKMKNIVVPVDFSKHSENAFNYARSLAAEINANLKLVHVCHPGVDTINGFTIPQLDELVDFKTRKLEEFAESHRGASKKETSVAERTTTELVVGFANDELVKLSEDSDAIIMGTRGEGGLFEKLFGSVSSHVSQNSKCPVWLIPPDAKFEGFGKIAYASNFESVEGEVFKEILDLSKLFDSEIHLVHVSEDKEDIPLDSLALETEFKEEAPSFNVKVAVLEGKLVWKALNDFANNNDIDLMVMLTRQRSFWNRLLHKSQTRELILHAKVPLLVLHFEA